MALRVPTPDVSVVDVTLRLEKGVSSLFYLSIVFTMLKSNDTYFYLLLI